MITLHFSMTGWHRVLAEAFIVNSFTILQCLVAASVVVRCWGEMT